MIHEQLYPILTIGIVFILTTLLLGLIYLFRTDEDHETTYLDPNIFLDSKTVDVTRINGRYMVHVVYNDNSAAYHPIRSFRDRALVEQHIKEV